MIVIIYANEKLCITDKECVISKDYLMHFPLKLVNTDLTLEIILLMQSQYGKLMNKLMK